MIWNIPEFLFGLFVLSIRIFIVHSHGRLVSPPARSSAWRYRSGFPAYYDDTAMYCGGFNTQWVTNGGRCGICGEAWNKPKEFEKGGKFYRGTIVETFKKNQQMKVVVEITAGHKGYLEFRICNVDGWEGDATNACFRQNPLKDADGKTRFKYIDGFNTYLLYPPKDMTCKHCVFQVRYLLMFLKITLIRSQRIFFWIKWKFHAGNSWGTFYPKRGGCIGCGPQEEFYGKYLSVLIIIIKMKVCYVIVIF